MTWRGRSGRSGCGCCSGCSCWRCARAAGGAQAPGWTEHLHLVPATAFGPVQGRVGRGHQLLQLTLAAALQRSDADRGGDLNRLAPGSVQGQRRDAVADPVGDPDGVHRPGPGQQDDELLAAEPAGQIVVAQRAGQAQPDLAQHLIPEQMPVGVVDQLEPVQVKHGHGQRLARVHGPGQRRGGLVFPGPGVQQPGLGVHPGVADQLGVPDRP